MYGKLRLDRETEGIFREIYKKISGKNLRVNKDVIKALVFRVVLGETLNLYLQKSQKSLKRNLFGNV